ncbi:hypothetical protein [Streptomyces niveiscabiei]|uniref:hypothetical protein n=1 Tax=Streptomyces niveiscabiei TaxID=164115 RepID=UPI0038F7D95F
MSPEDLISQYVFRPGVCWRCETPGLVAELTEWMPRGALCSLCVIRLDQLDHAEQQRRAMSAGRHLSAEEAAGLWPRRRTAEELAPLRAWIEGLLCPLDRLPGAYGVTGRLPADGSPSGRVPPQPGRRAPEEPRR